MTTADENKINAYFGHLKRHDSLERHILEAKLEGKRRKGRPTKRWTDDIREWLQMSPAEAGGRAQKRDVLDGWSARQRPYGHARNE